MLWLAIVLEYGDAGLNDNKKKKKSFNYLLVNKLASRGLVECRNLIL